MRVGIVGVGFMGTTHAAGWAETPAQIVGFTAETQNETGKLAAQYNAEVYPSLDAMLPDIDRHTITQQIGTLDRDLVTRAFHRAFLFAAAVAALGAYTANRIPAITLWPPRKPGSRTPSSASAPGGPTGARSGPASTSAGSTRTGPPPASGRSRPARTASSAAAG